MTENPMKENKDMKRVAAIAVVVLVALIFPLTAQTPPAPVPTPPTPPAPAQRLPQFIFGNLATPDAEWVTAYPNEATERSRMIYTLRKIIDRLGEQQQTITATGKRIEALEKQVAALPKPNAPIDAAAPPEKK